MSILGWRGAEELGDWNSGMAAPGLLFVMSLLPVGCSSTPEPTPPPIITGPVQTREKDRPLVSTPESEYTVIIEGRVTDADTGMTIPNATILVVTVTGSHEFWGRRVPDILPRRDGGQHQGTSTRIQG